MVNVVLQPHPLTTCSSPPSPPSADPGVRPPAAGDDLVRLPAPLLPGECVTGRLRVWQITALYRSLHGATDYIIMDNAWGGGGGGVCVHKRKWGVGGVVDTFTTSINFLNH